MGSAGQVWAYFNAPPLSAGMLALTTDESCSSAPSGQETGSDCCLCLCAKHQFRVSILFGDPGKGAGT